MRDGRAGTADGSGEAGGVTRWRRLHPGTVQRFGWWLGLITAGGLALRVIVVVISRNEAVGGDGFAYGYTANRNVTGHWFVNIFNQRPDAIHPPVWTLILTVWAELGQHSVFRQQLLCCVIGTCTVALVGLAGRRIAGDRVGLVAAAIAAVYAGLWLYERALLSETVLLPLIAVMVILVYSFRDHPSIGRAALLGAMCGLLAMTRSEEILIFPLLAVPLILTARRVNWRARISWLVISTLLVAVVIAPWTIYNLGRFQRPIFLSTNGGGAVATANCDGTYFGSHIGWYDILCGPYPQPSDPSVANSADLRYGIHNAEHHLSRLPLVVFAREGRAFGYWNPFQQTYLDNRWQTVAPIFGTKTSVWVYDLRLVSYWILLIPAIAGCVVLRRRRIPLYPLLSFVLTVAITVAIAYGETRYRAAAEVPLVILAAVGIEAVLPRKRLAPIDEAASPLDREPAPEPNPELTAPQVTPQS
ncbi:MAG TPA: glycosyltransferase family 39 protein [Acidimicrobiales bacterium]|nr:glycosyltransferase family 39 protein [Acidimicrobiales bacterium]